jgi:hypothetical protein
MSNSFRIRLNLSQREIEIEGSEEFLNSYQELILDYANRIKENTSAIDSSREKNFRKEEQKSLDHEPKEAFSFGEFFTKFPKNIKDVDRILIAGYFLQSSRESKSFSTREASALLLEQNIKLSNASAFLKSSLDTRKIFRLNNKDFRVSDIGIDYINSLKQN